MFNDIVIIAVAMALYVYRNREDGDSPVVGFIVGLLFGRLYIIYAVVLFILDIVVDVFRG